MPLGKFKQTRTVIIVLLGCYIALVGSQLPTFRDNISVPSSRVTQTPRIARISFTPLRKPEVTQIAVVEIDGTPSAFRVC
jgi:hypothetical protein